VSGVPRVRTTFNRCRNYAGNETADASSPGCLALDVLVDVPLCVLVIRVENGRLLQLSLAIRIDFSSSLVIWYQADDTRQTLPSHQSCKDAILVLHWCIFFEMPHTQRRRATTCFTWSSLFARCLEDSKNSKDIMGSTNLLHTTADQSASPRFLGSRKQKTQLRGFTGGSLWRRVHPLTAVPRVQLVSGSQG